MQSAVQMPLMTADVKFEPFLPKAAPLSTSRPLSRQTGLPAAVQWQFTGQAGRPQINILTLVRMSDSDTSVVAGKPDQP